MPRNFQGSSRLCFAALLYLSIATGCAGPRASERVVWPFPPEKPRIEYVRSIASTNDVESGWRRFWSSISGKRPVAVFNPTAIAMGPDDRVYVSLSTSGTVLAFDLTKGVGYRVAAEEGHKPKLPYGIAVDGAGNLYVGDQGENVVWAYDAKGKFVRQIGKGMLERPTGLAFDRQRRMLYVVNGGHGTSMRHQIEVFDPDGRHLRTIGKRGEGPGEFNFPSSVVVAPDGRLFVADTGNFRVQVFSPDGDFVTMFGSVGEAPGQFGKPKGLAFDSFGNLYVVDGQVGIVQMFSPSFRPLMFFGGAANRPEFMYAPNGIAIDSQNRIFVSDFGFNHVNEYRLFNTTAADSAGK